MPVVEDSLRLRPYVPRLVVDWLRDRPEALFQEVEGSLAFVDISGFTTLTERLARKGKVGAEEMSDALNSTFAALLAEAYDEGAGLVKWGGDAVLLLFDGPNHAPRAARAGHRMRARMRVVGRLETSAGQVVLRMSTGIHSGIFHFFLVGDPAHHRELLVSGPAASRTAEMEALANAGQIAVSPQTAALLAPRTVGVASGEGFILRSLPDVPVLGVFDPKNVDGLDLTRVVPAGIREHVLADPGDAEHRTIAVAFVQFSGTDDLLARSGPAALAAALDAVVRNVQDATSAHGVTFFETDINRDGGKIMLTAGAPRSMGHEEDRMLRATRLIVDRIGELPLRIGVNRGPVFSGDFGPAFRRTYSVKGDAINLAARVMGKAAPGQLLATQAVVERSETLFEVEKLPPFKVKGKSQVVDAVVVGPLAGLRDVNSSGSVLVGREKELAVLTGVLSEVREARGGGVVEVLGEAGIGKSRLVRELVGRAVDVTAIATVCDEYESRTAYLPIRRMLRSLLGIGSGASDVEATERLLERVETLAPELVPWLPLLGVVLGLSIESTSQTRDLEERFKKTRLEEVTADFLAAAMPRGALLIIEDGHFLDDASAELLRRFAGLACDQRWLIVVSARRSVARLVAAAGESGRRVHLAGLTDEQSLAFVDAAMEDAPLPPQAAAVLVQRSGGNPLFLYELIGVARATGGVDQLPESVEGLVTAEIDRLLPSQRTVLRYAAVMGMTVEEEILRELVTDPPLPEGRAAFRPLASFLVPSGEGRLRFRHTMIRDVAYDALPYRRRKALHETVGALLMRRMVDPAATPEPLALHFHHAGRAEEAWIYARLAAARARGQYAQAEASDYLTWAADSGKRAGAAPAEVAEVLQELGDVRMLLGQPRAAAATYRLALREARDDVTRQANLLLKGAVVEQRLGNLPQSLRRLTRGIRLVDGEVRPEARVVHAQLATRYGIVRMSAGRFAQAKQWGDRAVALAERAKDPEAEASAHNLLQMVTLWSAETSDVPHGEIALGLYEKLDDLPGQAHCLNNLAVQAIFEGRWDDALETISRAIDIFRSVGDAAAMGNAVYNRGDVLVRQGRVAEADLALQEALRIARGVDDEELVALVLRELGKSACRGGRFEQSLQLLTEASERLTALGEPQELVDASAAVAETRLLMGDWVAALAACDEALPQAHDVGAATLIPTLLRIRGIALLEGGRPDEARAAFDEGLSLGTSPVTRHERAFLLAGKAELARRDNDPSAEALLAESDALLTGLGVVVAPLPGRVARSQLSP